MGDRLVGMLVGVVVGVIPGFAMIFIASTVTDGFADQAGMIWGLTGMLLIVAGAIIGAIIGARSMPHTKGQVFAGLVLGVLPGLAVWKMLNEVNTVALVLLIVGPLTLGALGLRSDIHHHGPTLAAQ
ncbi:MAG: hypothetical protein ABFR89_07445 [Actinomycetota bacterium]